MLLNLEFPTSVARLVGRLLAELWDVGSIPTEDASNAGEVVLPRVIFSEEREVVALCVQILAHVKGPWRIYGTMRHGAPTHSLTHGHALICHLEENKSRRITNASNSSNKCESICSA